MQVTTACDSKDMPNDVREAWSLSYEFLLYEAERSLMKLLLDIQGDSGNGTAELRVRFHQPYCFPCKMKS